MKTLEHIPLNGELPSPKGVALAILELCRKDDATIAEVARIAQTDPALASRLIRQANSAAHGGGRPVASVTEAMEKDYEKIQGEIKQQAMSVNPIGFFAPGTLKPVREQKHPDEPAA